MVCEKRFTRKNFRAMLRQRIIGRLRNTTTWEVPSASTPGCTYQVKAKWQEGRIHVACTCQSGQLNQPCKHGLYVARRYREDTWLLLALELACARDQARVLRERRVSVHGERAMAESVLLASFWPEERRERRAAA